MITLPLREITELALSDRTAILAQDYEFKPIIIISAQKMQPLESKRSTPSSIITYLRMVASFWKHHKVLVSTSDLITYFPKWKASLGNDRSPLKDEMPWLTFSAIDFLDKILTSDSKVFEYGAGGSTLFFAKIVDRVVSVEHDVEWFKITEKTIESHGYKNWTGHLVESKYDETLCEADSADPNLYASSDVNFKCSSFQDYVLTIDNYQDEYFDLVIVDGRSRPSCVKRAMSKVKQKGYLLLDNAERESYSLAYKLLDNNEWEKHSFSGPVPYNYCFSETCMWQKK
jgi:predicted O-methyltransferase YrrM